MPALKIRIKKNRDGTAVLTCVREDGTTAWQRQEGPRAAFFPLHDLTHFAVETILEHRRGFYGLVAEGWDFADFGTPWPRGPLPADADPSELIVGFLDAERASGIAWSAQDLAEKAAGYFANQGISAPPLGVTDADLARIREMRAELFERWASVPAGETLELNFEVPATPHPRPVDAKNEVG